MNAISRALRDFLAERPAGIPFALVGGIAVSARTEPRFTRDLDFAVAVADDEAAARYVFDLRQAGYEVDAALEQVERGRMSSDDKHRPRDREDLVQLVVAATAADWSRAREAVIEIERRGFARGRDLQAALDQWRRGDR